MCHLIITNNNFQSWSSTSDSNLKWQNMRCIGKPTDFGNFEPKGFIFFFPLDGEKTISFFCLLKHKKSMISHLKKNKKKIEFIMLSSVPSLWKSIRTPKVYMQKILILTIEIDIFSAETILNWCHHHPLAISHTMLLLNMQLQFSRKWKSHLLIRN